MVINRLISGQAELKPLNEDSFDLLELILTPNCGFFQKTRITFQINVSEQVPRISCNARLFHPNIGREGNICFNMLGGDGWSNGYSLDHYVVGLLWLLSNPNPDSALNSEAAISNPQRYAKLVERASCGLSVQGTFYTEIRKRRESDGLMEVPVDLWVSELHSQPNKFVCPELANVQPSLDSLASIGLRLSEVSNSRWTCVSKHGWSLTFTFVDGKLPQNLPVDDYCRVYFLQQEAGIRLFGGGPFQAALDLLLAANITVSAPAQQNEAPVDVSFATIGQPDRYQGRLDMNGLSVDLVTFLRQDRGHPATCYDLKWPQESIRLLRDTVTLLYQDSFSSERVMLSLALPPSQYAHKAIFDCATGQLCLSPLLLFKLSPELRQHFGEPLGASQLRHALEMIQAGGVEVEECTPHPWSANLFQLTLKAVGTVSASYNTTTNKLTLTDVAVRNLGVGTLDWMQVTKLHDVAELQLIAPGVFQVRATSSPHEDCLVWLLTRDNASAVFLSEPGISAEAAARLLPQAEGWNIQGEGTVRDLLVSPLVFANECVLSRPTVMLRTISPNRRAFSLGSTLHHFLMNSDQMELRVMNKHLLFRRTPKSPTGLPQAVKAVSVP